MFAINIFVAIALAVLAGITFGSGTIVKLLPTLALALSIGSGQYIRLHIETPFHPFAGLVPPQ